MTICNDDNKLIFKDATDFKFAENTFHGHLKIGMDCEVCGKQIYDGYILCEEHRHCPECKSNFVVWNKDPIVFRCLNCLHRWEQ